MFKGYSLGFCSLDLLALILLILILAAIIVQNRTFKKNRDEYQKALEEKNRR